MGNYADRPLRGPVYVENEELLNKIYDLVRNKGCELDVHIYTALGFGKSMWQKLKQKPESKIKETIRRAKDDILCKAKENVYTVANDPSRKEWFKANTFIIDRADKLAGNNKVTLVHEHADDAKQLTDAELDAQLTSTQPTVQ